MVKSYNKIFFLILILSCNSHQDTIPIADFNSKALVKYCNDVKKINIDKKCGLVKDVKLKFSNSKTKMIDIFIDCHFYKGKFNFNENKFYKGNASVVILTDVDSVYYNSNIISIDSFKLINNKNLYIIRNDWNSKEELKIIKDYILNKDSVKLIFEYKSKTYLDEEKEFFKNLKVPRPFG